MFKTKPKFPLGRLAITPGAIDALAEANQLPIDFLSRHSKGDWGDVNEEDWQENDFSMKNGFRILSAYKTSKGERLWVITEADRSVTTILRPEDY
jgi:hypothetical protein